SSAGKVASSLASTRVRLSRDERAEVPDVVRHCTEVECGRAGIPLAERDNGLAVLSCARLAAGSLTRAVKPAFHSPLWPCERSSYPRCAAPGGREYQMRVPADREAQLRE